MRPIEFNNDFAGLGVRWQYSSNATLRRHVVALAVLNEIDFVTGEVGSGKPVIRWNLLGHGDDPVGDVAGESVGDERHTSGPQPRLRQTKKRKWNENALNVTRRHVAHLDGSQSQSLWPVKQIEQPHRACSPTAQFAIPTRTGLGSNESEPSHVLVNRTNASDRGAVLAGPARQMS